MAQLEAVSAHSASEVVVTAAEALRFGHFATLPFEDAEVSYRRSYLRLPLHQDCSVGVRGEATLGDGSYSRTLNFRMCLDDLLPGSESR